jgi:REP element-mobilizing transposase RayT
MVLPQILRGTIDCVPVADDTTAHRRRLPHLQRTGKTYSVTFCTLERRVLTPNQRDIALNCCVHDHRITYWLHCAVVMPDHVHMIAGLVATIDDYRWIWRSWIEGAGRIACATLR